MAAPFYLDNAASTRLHPEVLEAALPFLRDCYGNPSSLHPLGMQARRVVKGARETLARLLGAPPQAVTFTAGGTESCNLALQGAFASARLKGQRLLVSAIEHPAVLETAQRLAATGVDVRRIPVTAGGIVDLAALEALLDGDVRVVSVMALNNELGTAQPIEAIGRLLARVAPRTVFHVDAVQAFTKLPVNWRAAGVHLLSLSGHKVHGPKGVGALVRLRPVPLEPLIAGGGQEGGLRSGTENVFGIVALGHAAQRTTALHAAQREQRCGYADAWLTELAGQPRVEVFRSEAATPFIISFSLEPIPGEVILHHLEQEGLYVSTGSACASAKPEPSHVLLAAGLSERRALSSIRLSFSVFNTLDELPAVLPAFRRAMERLQRL
ncbi:MAG: cysteine desulfurase [Candidatus Lambdaproteobacteria bacterium]|nr:cysteine desulfurase [Candidatus Lambdaproteobacteria bacterium]